MATVEAPSEIQTLHVRKEIQIAAPIDIVFETVLENQGPFANMALKIEPWPGGRWYRDLGNNTGHLWGHVQVIKPPKLLEITGPMMMSYPVASHVQYRLTEEAGGTKLVLVASGDRADYAGAFGRRAEGLGEIVAGVKSAAESKRGK